jgi:hypothetical protein
MVLNISNNYYKYEVISDILLNTEYRILKISE